RLAVRHTRRRVADASRVVVTHTDRWQRSQLYPLAPSKPSQRSELPFSIAIGLNKKRDEEQPHQDDHHEDSGGEVWPLKCDQCVEWHRLTSLSMLVTNSIVAWGRQRWCALVHTSIGAGLANVIKPLGRRSLRLRKGVKSPC